MKPKNFPARKIARQIAAKERAAGFISEARHVHAFGSGAGCRVDAARAIRTKKNRGHA